MGNLLKRTPAPLDQPPLALPYPSVEPGQEDPQRVATLERTVEVLVASLLKKDRELRVERYSHNFSVFMAGFASSMLNNEDHAALLSLMRNTEYMEIHRQTGLNWSEVEPQLKKITAEYLDRRNKQ